MMLVAATCWWVAVMLNDAVMNMAMMIATLMVRRLIAIVTVVFQNMIAMMLAKLSRII